MMILTDCDGVLVDWIKIYNEWMEEEGFRKLNSSYELHERYGLPEAGSDRMIRFFNMSAEIEHLPPHKDAIKYVRKFHEDHGVTFHCVTALGSNKRSHLLREKNLKNSGEIPRYRCDMGWRFDQDGPDGSWVRSDDVSHESRIQH